MKAARLDEPLQAISKTMFLDLPQDEAVSPQEFLETNLALRLQLEREIEMKYTIIEEAAIEIIDRFVDTFDVESVAEEKYLWLDSSKILKPSNSAFNLAVPDDIGIINIGINSFRIKNPNLLLLIIACIHFSLSAYRQSD